MTQETPEQIGEKTRSEVQAEAIARSHAERVFHRHRFIIGRVDQSALSDAIAAAIQAERERAEKEHDEEIGEFQQQAYALICRLSGKDVDGAGSDAGWQEFTLAEISEGLAHVIERAEQAEKLAVKLRSGWSRVRDLAMAGHGPTECFTFQEAVRLEDGKCVETVIRYLNSTVDRAEKAERELEEAEKVMPMMYRERAKWLERRKKANGSKEK
jgi:hypothetical protein